MQYTYFPLKGLVWGIEGDWQPEQEILHSALNIPVIHPNLAYKNK